MAQTVWLSRHGNRQDFVDPDWRRSAEWPHDPGLSPDGLEQAQQLGQRLAQEHVEYIFASPFLRTVQTAHAVAEALDQRVYLEPGIGEWMNAEWFDGPPERRDPEVLAEEYPSIDLNYTPRGEPSFPETKEETFARAGETARRLAGAYSGPILLIGHGITVTGSVNGLLGRTRDMECALCTLYKLVRHGEGWTMELEGDAGHLDHVAAANRFN